MRRAIVLILDGLRRDMISPELTPNLAAHAARSESFAAHRSVFPSATRVVSSSMATGCYPAKHELAGNSLVLVEDGRLVAHDAGHPAFLQHKRRVTGRSLAMPTMAERLRDHGGAIIYANVSPGAAYAHDPDGHGIVYHRVGSFGPGRVPVTDWDASRITIDPAGDRYIAERFISDVVVGPRKPALSLMWLSEPDFSSHGYPLGSPEQLSAVSESDATAGLVFAAVAEREPRATTSSSSPARTMATRPSVPSSTSRPSWWPPASRRTQPREMSFQPRTEPRPSSTSTPTMPHERPKSVLSCAADRGPARSLAASDLARLGQAPRNGLAFAVAMAATETPNSFGIPGTSYAAKPSAGKQDRLNCGQHGGLARYEQAPFMMIDGPGFRPGTSRSTAPRRWMWHRPS